MKSKNIFFMGYLIASATFAEDIGVPVEPINVGSRAAMPSEGESLALLPFAEDVPPVRDAMPSEVPKSAAGGDVRGGRSIVSCCRKDPILFIPVLIWA
ncbi:TPA: hypothetical protein ACKKAG_001297 [Neisseria gonorrhoeae]